MPINKIWECQCSQCGNTEYLHFRYKRDVIFELTRMGWTNVTSKSILCKKCSKNRKDNHVEN